MKLNDLKELANRVFADIRNKAKEKGVEQIEIAIQYDISGHNLAEELDWSPDDPIIAASSDNESPAWEARRKIVYAREVFETNYRFHPSDDLMDYSSEASSSEFKPTSGGLYFPIGYVAGGCPRRWYTEVYVGVGVHTGNPEVDKRLAIVGARAVSGYFGENGFLAPEIFCVE